MQNENGSPNGSPSPTSEQVELAARAAVAHALWMKKQLGLPAVVWRDGKPTTIPASEIVVDEELLKHAAPRIYFPD
jgi:hypothetical protein